MKLSLDSVREQIKFFPIARNFFSAAAIVLLLSSVSYCWYLGPLSFDGSRFTVLLFQSQHFHTELRPLHGLFQIPVLTLMRFLPKSPLVLVRVYFLTLVLPILFVYSLRIWRARNQTELAIAAATLFVGVLPGLSFPMSSVFETSFFFTLMVYSYLFTKGKFGFYLGGAGVAFGHPIFIPALFFFSLLVLISSGKKLRELVFLFVLICISSYLTVKAIRYYPTGTGNSLQTISSYFLEPGKPYTGILHVTVVFTLLTSTFIFLRHQPNWLWPLTMVVLLFLLIRYPGADALHVGSFGYRIFTAFFIIFLMGFLCLFTLKPHKSLKTPYLLALALVTIPYLYWNVVISRNYRRIFHSLSDLPHQEGCEVIRASKLLSTYTQMSLPIEKLFVDNRQVVRSLVLSARNESEMDLCERVSADPHHLSIPIAPPYRLNIPIKGYFDFRGVVFR